MNVFERVPTSWLIAGAVVACLALFTAPSSAQTSGNAVSGKRLFEDTPNESGHPTLGSCTNCHAWVQNRRSRIATTVGITPGGVFADIDLATALLARRKPA